ncbi:hypothetical protein SDRG_09510 [Saprolegnia diclina VS20]|uniref:N-acetyltransferase domain-containing protein n=1 Tax=Saprolegnia diclina (strain VS20) TaxID=1156394 RepID=T0RL55_SAPDV|nr:hypothetical protein SDRG_09510 [Saprolegnia diclina VS20]EQC32988.1 hypothetical protein SDRG_09510 [Saprolegnia diclina VS20]|eukprot:XP_008613674.1 hypothetical protein SDRG_09510 [Saprolegnia diclina VS20]
MATTDFEVRRLASSDVAATRRLNMAALPVPVAEHAYKDAIASQMSWVAVQRSSNALVGAILVEPEGDGTACIRTLAVDIRHRAKGVGSLLLQTAVDSCASYARIYLHVQVENADAIQVYKRAGFIVESHVPNYYRRVACTDCYIMALYGTAAYATE